MEVNRFRVTTLDQWKMCATVQFCLHDTAAGINGPNQINRQRLLLESMSPHEGIDSICQWAQLKILAQAAQQLDSMGPYEGIG
jgi:hypothetical protein